MSGLCSDHSRFFVRGTGLASKRTASACSVRMRAQTGSVKMDKVEHVHFARSPVKEIGNIPTTTVNNIICGLARTVFCNMCASLKTTLVSISEMIR